MCRRVQGYQIFKQDWIISIRSRVIVILLIWISLALGVGQVGGGYPGWSTIVYMSSEMFRGKESSSTIELFWLVQELLNFGVLGSLWLWGVGGWGGGGLGVGGWGGGWLGGAPHTCAHACTHMHAHACVVNMIISWKWPFPLGESMEIPYDVIHMCTCMHIHACMCMCTCMGGTLSPSHTPSTHPPTPGGDPWNQSKFNSTWTNRDISILFKDLKSVETPPPMGGCTVWWVGGWVDGWGQVKSLKI